MTASPSIEICKIEETLRYRAKDAADLISDPDNCCSSQRDWTEDQWKGYAMGQVNLLSDLAERFEIDHCGLQLHQIDGAIGERYRRLNPKKNQLRSRALNPILNAIRDLRIRMRDDYILASYNFDIAPKEKRLRRFMSGEHASNLFWEELQVTNREMAALRTFNSQCLSDKHWFAEYFRRSQINAANARAIEVLETDL